MTDPTSSVLFVHPLADAFAHAKEKWNGVPWSDQEKASATAWAREGQGGSRTWEGRRRTYKDKLHIHCLILTSCGEITHDDVYDALPPRPPASRAMTHRAKRQPKPRYHQTYPSTLATSQELHALGLRPGTSEPDAILEYQRGNKSGICGLFDRAKAVPVTAPGEQD